MAQGDVGKAISQPEHPSILGGLLSYLVPGLGQIYQGRVGKGLLFLICLLGLFFAGQAMGGWKNVYLPDVVRGPDDVRNNPFRLPRPLANLYHRWPFAGQFFIGVAAWPAIWQYNQLPVPIPDTQPFWRNFQKAPQNEAELNNFLRAQDKTPDLGLVYTIVAGVLNILVIYDAIAGPAFVAKTVPPPQLPSSLSREVAS